jgi:hypothetical protein
MLESAPGICTKKSDATPMSAIAAMTATILTRGWPRGV